MNTRTPEEITDMLVKDFQAACCPFGYLDIATAIRHTQAIGEDGEWLFDLVQERVEELGYRFADMDICYVILDHTLQMARNNIDSVTGFDFLNDGCGKVDTYGNYMCSSYDSYEELKEELAQLFTEKQITEDMLDKTTLYFLSLIGFTF